jgi:hypothetical protein
VTRKQRNRRRRRRFLNFGRNHARLLAEATMAKKKPGTEVRASGGWRMNEDFFSDRRSPGGGLDYATERLVRQLQSIPRKGTATPTKAGVSTYRRF